MDFIFLTARIQKNIQINFSSLKELKFCLLHITILLLYTSISQAQTDSTQNSILQKLTSDLSAISESQNHGVTTTFSETEGITAEFAAKYRSMPAVLFSNPISGAASYYTFLNNLSPDVQESLVTHYSEFELRVHDQIVAVSLPQEISFLAPALSAMNIRSIGNEKRAGLWQLTHFQAVLNGLKVTRLMDERFDEGHSTLAVIAELVKMKKEFGTDEHAVLAFLSGPVTLRNALPELPENASTADILPLLPQSVSETLAVWQAMTVFLTENKAKPETQLVAFDTIQTGTKLHFQQLAEVLGVSLSSIQKLNPHYPYSVVPGSENACYIYLPKGKKEEFLRLEDSIYQLSDSSFFEVLAQKIEYPPAPTRQYVGEKVKDLEIEGKTKIKYTLKSGDVLGFIAEDYNVEVEDLKYWNNIYNERRIQAGQKLDIFVNDEDADYYRQLHPEPLTKSGKANPAAAASFPIPVNARKIEHEVRSGESPYVIAQKYKGVSPEAILYWNGISDARKIQIGQKLTIYVSE